VERERGITVKAKTCSMVYDLPEGFAFPGANRRFLLNLIDTPGS